MGKISPRFPSRRTVAATAAVSAFAAALTSLSHPPALWVDGQRIVSDVPPVTTARGAYLPLRAVAETLGARAEYDAKTGDINVVGAGRRMRLHVGDKHATFDGGAITLKTPPFTVRGRTMVSLQVIAKALRTHVRYDTTRSQIDVMTTGTEEAAAQQDADTP